VLPRRGLQSALVSMCVYSSRLRWVTLTWCPVACRRRPAGCGQGVSSARRTLPTRRILSELTGPSRSTHYRRMQTGNSKGIVNTLTQSYKAAGTPSRPRPTLPLRHPPPLAPRLDGALADPACLVSGFVNGVYPGLSASIFRQMTYSLTRFGVYDALKEKFSQGLAPGESLPPWKLAVAASIAGGLGGVAGNPADVVLVRMTGDGNRPPAQRLNYKHWYDAESGWRARSRGTADS